MRIRRASRAARLLPGILVVAAALCGEPGRAQMADFLQLRPPLTAREAFDSQYGRSVIDAFAGALERAADPACAANAGIAAAAWPSRAETLLVRHGQAHLDRMRAAVDQPRLEAEFRRLGGGAVEELRRLRDDPAIAALGAPIRTRQILDLIDNTVQLFDRYATLTQLPLAPVSPLATGEEQLLRLREEIEESALDAFEAQIRDNDTPAMRRFVDLTSFAAGAMLASIDGAKLAAIGPVQALAGLDGELRGYCIAAR